MSIDLDRQEKDLIGSVAASRSVPDIGFSILPVLGECSAQVELDRPEFVREWCDGSRDASANDAAADVAQFPRDFLIGSVVVPNGPFDHRLDHGLSRLVVIDHTPLADAGTFSDCLGLHTAAPSRATTNSAASFGYLFASTESSGGCNTWTIVSVM